MAISVTPAALVNVSAISAPVVDSMIIYDPVYVGDNAVEVRWETDLRGPFSIYLDGVEVKTTYAKRSIVHVDDEHSVIDVLSAEETEDVDPVASARFRLRWSAATLADYYRVQRYIDSSWTTIAEIPDRGQSAFEFVTGPLDDDQSHQFRVYAVRTNGTPSAALEIIREMVRDPDPPDVDLAYNDGSGTVTISAA